MSDVKITIEWNGKFWRPKGFENCRGRGCNKRVCDLYDDFLCNKALKIDPARYINRSPCREIKKGCRRILGYFEIVGWKEVK